MISLFDNQDLRNISDVLSGIITHSKITEYLQDCNISESGGSNKSDRIYYALKERQDRDGCGNNVMAFILRIISPKRYNSELDFERDRTLINEKLAFVGYSISQKGELKVCTKASTISEAQERSQKIKKKIHGLKIHHNIIPYCDEEWLSDDYFHAIEEVAKSVFDVLKQKSGNHSIDGAMLVDYCFALKDDKTPKPKLAFNLLSSDSEISEHKGFANFCKGFYGMYRNPKAHSSRKNEETSLEQLAEVLVVATIIHNRLDSVYPTGY